MRNPYAKRQRRKQDDEWFIETQPQLTEEDEISASAIYDFVIQKGTTLDYDITYKDDNNTPFDLTGYKAKCMAQYHDKIFSITATISDPENGVINLYMSPYDTSEIYTDDYRYARKTEYNYQLDLLSSGKVVYRILVGKIFVEPMSGVIE